MSLSGIIWTAVAMYFVIAIAAFIFNANIGPVTPGLALLRALLWPLWLLGMIPGKRLPMD